MSYTEPARTTTVRVRMRWIRVVGIVCVIAAIAAAATRHTGSSARASRNPLVRTAHRGAPGAPDGPPLLRGGQRGAPGEGDGAAVRSAQGGALGEADGAVPDGTTVLDDRVPGVAKLDPALLGALRQAATDAAADGVEFFVDSGWRSPRYQEQLLREAISKYGSRAEATRWVATPKTSAHVKGDAVDIGTSRATAWLSEHGAEYGLCQIYANEPWHYELRPHAGDRGCPAAYADPTHDPRMHR